MFIGHGCNAMDYIKMKKKKQRMKEKNYLFYIKEPRQFFIHKLFNKQHIKDFIKINYPKSKVMVFLIKECVFDNANGKNEN